MSGCFRGYLPRSTSSSPMTIDFPKPRPRALTKVSPTLANDLLACALRVAWRLDDRFDGLRRPTPWSELGVVAHGVVEDVGRGLLASSTTVGEAKRALEAAWEGRLQEAQANLQDAWAPASPPPPPEWPGFHLVRVRTIRRALRLFEVPQRERPVVGATIEKTFEDSETRLFGRPDRVEWDGTAHTVVDLKTGLRQGGATDAQRRQLLLYAHLVGVETGTTPSRVAIEDPSGRRWEEPITRESVSAAVNEVLAAKSKFESASREGRWDQIAQPSAETCRRCPYRVVCRHYWMSLELGWGHGSVAGTVTGSRHSKAGSIAEVSAESPRDASGDGWVVSATPTAALAEGDVAIVDAELTGSDRILRWRWSTLARSFEV
jgi:hypothetical protein